MTTVLFGSMIGGTIGFVLELVAITALLLVVAFLALRFFNKNAAGSLWHLGRTKAGQAGDYAKTIDPAGQMRQAAIDAGEELKGADDALIESDKLKTRLTRQVESDTKTKNKIEGQIAKLLNDGVAESDSRIVEKLKRVRDLTNTIAENNIQIETQNGLYKTLLAKANGASQKIAAAMQRADQMKVRLDLGVQTQKITEMLSKYNPAAVRSKLAKIDEYEQAAQGQLDGYAAAAKVAADRAAVTGDDEDDDDNVTPETDEELGSLLAGIKAKKVRPKAFGPGV